VYTSAATASKARAIQIRSGLAAGGRSVASAIGLSQNEALRKAHWRMPIEVEQKFPVADAEALARRLMALGASAGETQEQVDGYFAHPERDFATSDEALRLRRVGAHNYLTYKGPKLDATTKTRHEIELELGTGDQAAEDAGRLLEALGFRPVAEVRKKRIHYTLAWSGQQIGVSIDRVAGLGDFVELEIMAGQENLDAARGAIATLADRLDLSNSERRSYLELVLAARAGRPDRP
jgi:adenylate cyclase class 2